MSKTVGTSLLLVSMIIAWPIAALTAQPRLARFSYSQRHMGTLCRISLYASEERAAVQAANAAFERIADLDRVMTDYQPTSELMRLCQKAGDGPALVSDDLLAVISKAQEISALSGGAFDISVGPLVRLWRNARRTQVYPEKSELERARSLVGYQNIRLDPAKRTVQLIKAGMLLDLGGIAKGYAADQAIESLHEHGIDRALVAMGGDIAVSHPPPGAESWRIGIGPIEEPGTTPRVYIRLKDAAVSTSGDAEQHVEIAGIRYSHLIDPRTGVALTGRQSVTVVAPKGVLADALTKVVAILVQERAFSIVESIPGTAAYVVRENGGVKEYFSKRFKSLMEGAKP
jgi:thiamine biosynthesis lipoprotein